MSDVIAAASLEITRCEDDCECQSVHVLLMDEDEQIVATASLSPKGARGIGIAMVQLADEAEANQLRRAGRLA
ncbi:MAG: hypothetical protein AAFR53_06250 [Pseudomonadota bacterium]